DAHRPLPRGGLAARYFRLGELVVHGRLHALPGELVPAASVSGSAGLSQPLSDYIRDEHSHADLVHPGRGGLPHAAHRWRRRAVPRTEVAEASDGDGALPRRVA